MTSIFFRNNHQKGVSLIITFLMMTIMLTIILSLSIIVSNKIKVIRDIDSSSSAFNAAYSGMEKTLYFDAKQAPPGANRGLCNTCNVCTDCLSCKTVSLAPSGCDLIKCVNCELTYNSAFDGRSYNIDAKVTPDAGDPTLSDFYINSQGFYQNTTRTITRFFLPGTLEIDKVAQGGNGTFTYTVTGPTPFVKSITTVGGSGSFTKLVTPASTYAITESLPGGHWQFCSASCDKSFTLTTNGVSNVTVLPGEKTTCTFTNVLSGLCSVVPPP